MFQFCQISSGGSVAGAKQLNHNSTGIAINWEGLFIFFFSFVSSKFKAFFIFFVFFF
ncbi:histone deacetylase [Anaeramoeba flamelloides]|uniref:Histone deacetylase n=1 Tax=Anaeramoeba flamelloides TaxID=1746091 RepID=A0AAV7YD55_9EUKA|nr:histone deacetylase [Anaeramoeba flamelloides]